MEWDFDPLQVIPVDIIIYVFFDQNIGFKEKPIARKKNKQEQLYA